MDGRDRPGHDGEGATGAATPAVVIPRAGRDDPSPPLGRPPTSIPPRPVLLLAAEPSAWLRGLRTRPRAAGISRNGASLAFTAGVALGAVWCVADVVKHAVAALARRPRERVVYGLVQDEEGRWFVWVEGEIMPLKWTGSGARVGQEHGLAAAMRLSQR